MSPSDFERRGPAGADRSAPTSPSMGDIPARRPCLPAARSQAPKPDRISRLSRLGRSPASLGLAAVCTALGAARGQDPAHPARESHYVEARSTGVRRETEPPRYVRNLDRTEWFGTSGLGWLDLGLDYRFRYEYRDDDLRRPEQVLDQPILTRTRVYLGVHDLVDPLRGYVEFEDARKANSRFPDDDRDVDELEFIQVVGELHFADALGEDRPLRLQGGRLAFEYVDRRLIARNEWRNTTNNFEGFRAILGQQTSDWQLDLLALRPILRDTDDPDEPDWSQWFYGAILDWRRWSEVATLQPYYLLRRQEGDGSRPGRAVHTTGLRAYGLIGTTGFDWDLQGIYQFGEVGTARHEAFAITAEVGHTFAHDWKPRIGAFLGYATGDEDPDDPSNQRFDRLFGFARPWSANDYVSFDNVVAPKLRLDLRPHERVRIDLGYGAFWLAESKDLWAGARLQDRTGASGTFMGHELDVRVRIQLLDRVDVTLGYAHFLPGEFPTNLGKGADSDFFYVEVSPRIFP